jgi:hypothetical protein
MLIDRSIPRAIAVIEVAATQAPGAFRFLSGKNSRDDSHIESWALFLSFPSHPFLFGFGRKGDA